MRAKLASPTRQGESSSVVAEPHSGAASCGESSAEPAEWESESYTHTPGQRQSKTSSKSKTLKKRKKEESEGE